MDKLWKCMLSAKPKPEALDDALQQLTYPVLASPKLDGIRATVQNGRLYSRALKPIPNRAMQVLWGREELNGLDGEICVGPPTAADCFSCSTSAVMSREKSAEDAVFYVFDSFGPEPFEARTDRAYDAQDCDPVNGSNRIVHVTQELITNHKALLKYEARMLKRGYEGIMLRNPAGAYKQGRSTLREGGLIAVKRFVDAEAVILAVYEQERNENEKTVNELGRSKRSSHKAGKVGKGTFGGFTVTLCGEAAKDVHQLRLLMARSEKKDQFNVATGVGLTDKLRKELWAQRAKLPGSIIKFRYQECGTKDAPRIPIFLSFRDPSDL